MDDITALIGTAMNSKKSKKGGFSTLIKELVQEGYIDDKEYDKIADSFGVAQKTRDMEHRFVRVTNNIWTNQVKDVVVRRGNGSFWTDWDLRLQQGPISREEMLTMMKNSGENSVNVWRHEGYIEETREIANRIHAKKGKRANS